MGSSRSRRAPSRSLRPRPSCPVARLPGLSVAPATWSLSQAQVCREYCREGICRERCYNTREDGDVTVGIGRQRTFDRDRDRRDFDRDRDRDRDLDASATRTENTYRVSLSALLWARGHAAAPPSATNNSRRPRVTVIRPSRARCVKARIPRGERAVLTFKEGRMPVASNLCRGLRVQKQRSTILAHR